MRTAGEISQDRTTAPGGAEPGLKADYPFGEGQGLTAYDQTPSHNDGTLTGTWGFSLPTWVAPTALYCFSPALARPPRAGPHPAG